MIGENISTDKVAVGNSDVEQAVRQVIAERARLSEDAASLDANADLYRVGFTSYVSVDVMLALEEQFDIEFPDTMMNRTVFRSVESITTALQSLLEADA